MLENPLVATRQFLQQFCADVTDPTTLVSSLEEQVMVNARPILRGLQALTAVLAQDWPAGTLWQLVTETMQMPLVSQSDEAAKAWLVWLAEQIRREIKDNLLPFQPMRAELRRVESPADGRFPQDLWLYPTDGSFPEFGQAVWTRQHVFYGAFMGEWNGRTCPNCQTDGIKSEQTTKYAGEKSNTPYNTSIFYDKMTIYHCTHCQLGWTERTGNKTYTEVDFPR